MAEIVKDAVELCEDGVRLYVRIVPGASRERIEGIKEDSDGRQRLQLRVIAPADKGAANQALIRLLAKALKWPKSGIEINHGATARSKVLLIKGDADEIRSRIEALIGSPK